MIVDRLMVTHEKVHAILARATSRRSHFHSRSSCSLFKNDAMNTFRIATNPLPTQLTSTTLGTSSNSVKTYTLGAESTSLMSVATATPLADLERSRKVSRR